MVTVNADLTAITLDATELALAITRGTAGPLLVSVVRQKIVDLDDALKAMKAISSTNSAAIQAMRDKMLP